MRSRLYAGEVMHRRASPKVYRFRYGVYYFALDLDEIDEVERRIRVFTHNRRGVLAFYDRDHAGGACGVRESVRQRLLGSGVELDGRNIVLLTNTRVFGYVFNPVSFYFVRDSAGALEHVLAEVHNTHGERHVYDLPRDAGSAKYRSGTEKRFYVSPFIEMDGRYAFECVDLPGGRLDLRIEEYQGGEMLFEARLRLAGRALTNANVARMLLRYPLVTLKTTALIHWQGLKLWLRGVKHLPHTKHREANS